MHATLTDILTDVTANSIEAAAKHVSVSILEEGGVITLRVEDDGKGMPPEILARAFDPFYTEPGKHDKRKVGMGLPFVKQTCDARNSLARARESIESKPPTASARSFREIV